MEHLLNYFSFAKEIWSFLPYIFEQKIEIRKILCYSLSQWNVSLFLNPIVDRACILVGDFILRTLWKERNEIIFRNKRRNPKLIRGVIKQNIRQTITTSWMTNDWKVDSLVAKIMKKLELEQEM